MAEGMQEGAETQAAVQDALRMITAGTIADLEAFRAGPDDPPVPDELMAYGLFGAAEQATMRARWDEGFDQREVMLSHVFLYLAVEAAYKGTADAAARLDDYRDLIDRLIAAGPPVPRAALP
jgi:hypothetical protein